MPLVAMVLITYATGDLKKSRLARSAEEGRYDLEEGRKKRKNVTGRTGKNISNGPSKKTETGPAER
jgi:hypothetical protein